MQISDELPDALEEQKKDAGGQRNFKGTYIPCYPCCCNKVFFGFGGLCRTARAIFSGVSWILNTTSFFLSLFLVAIAWLLSNGGNVVGLGISLPFGTGHFGGDRSQPHLTCLWHP